MLLADPIAENCRFAYSRTKTSGLAKLSLSHSQWTELQPQIWTKGAWKLLTTLLLWGRYSGCTIHICTLEVSRAKTFLSWLFKALPATDGNEVVESNYSGNDQKLFSSRYEWHLTQAEKMGYLGGEWIPGIAAQRSDGTFGRAHRPCKCQRADPGGEDETCQTCTLKM